VRFLQENMSDPNNSDNDILCVKNVHTATTVSVNNCSQKPQLRCAEGWKEKLRVSGWESQYESVNKMLTFLRVRKIGSETTKESYCKGLAIFCNFANTTPDELAKMPKKKIKKLMDGFVEDFRKRGKSPKYINNILYMIKTFLLVNGRKIRIPTLYIPSRREVENEYVPTVEEVLRMIEIARGWKNKAAIGLGAFSGLRNSTVRALRYGDIKEELEKGVKNLCIKVYPDMKKIVPGACKGNITYYTFTIERVTQYLKLYVEEKKREFGELRDDDLLFNSEWSRLPKEERRKKPLSEAMLLKIVKNAAKEAGLEEEKCNKITFHSLRKTFQAFLRNQPAHLKLDYRDEEFLMGHVIGGSAEYYYRPKIEELRRKFSKMVVDFSEQIQMVIKCEEIDEYLRKGWKAKLVLPDGRIVVERG